MKLEYQQWVNNWLRNNTPHLKCKEATEEMKITFPELKRIRGHVLTEYGERPHWWLVDENDNVIDPTSTQFKIIGGYDAWDESQPEPTGRCLNCGELCYDYKSVCSDQCAIEYKVYIMSNRGF